MKKLFASVLIGLVVNASQASYLYWQVNNSDFSETGISAEYARVYAVDASGNETVLKVADAVSGASTSTSLVKTDIGSPAAINLEQLGNASAYSFYIELVNYNSAASSIDAVGKSTVSTYANLVQSNFVDVGDRIMAPQAEVWHGGSFKAVPEPTGTLMVMIGLGLLALKRRKV